LGDGKRKSPPEKEFQGGRKDASPPPLSGKKWAAWNVKRLRGKIAA